MKHYRVNKSAKDANHSESYWIKGPGMHNRDRAFHTYRSNAKENEFKNAWTHNEVLEMLEAAYAAGKDSR